MKSPEPASYASRTPSSGPRYNGSSFPPYSPTSASTAKKRNPAAEALRSIAGLFASCFTPPQLDASSNLDPSNSRSVASDGSGSGKRRRSSAGGSNNIYGSPTHNHKREPGSMKFTIDQIYRASNSFSPSFKIGQGGFGTVYKGKLE